MSGDLNNKFSLLCVKMNKVQYYIIKDKENEAFLRNSALVKIYGNIPSYALWFENDIGNDSDCIKWWKQLFQDLNFSALNIESQNWFINIASENFK